MAGLARKVEKSVLRMVTKPYENPLGQDTRLGRFTTDMFAKECTSHAMRQGEKMWRHQKVKGTTLKHVLNMGFELEAHVQSQDALRCNVAGRAVGTPLWFT